MTALRQLVTVAALPLLLAGQPVWANAATQAPDPINRVAVGMFMFFLVITIGITWWAARRSRSASEFFAAGGHLTGVQNGLAISGDTTSSATLLGVVGLVYVSGYDGLIYNIGFLVSWSVVMFLIAEPLRNLGRFTFADVLSFRLDEGPVRKLAAVNSLVIVVLYLISQLVGAGQLVELLFGLSYTAAVVMIGLFMMVYVTFGGMLGTSWVQIIKAALLMIGTVILSVGVLSHFGFSFERMFQSAVDIHPHGQRIMAPGGLIKDPISAVSLGIALVFGMAGRPDILMRLFTVPSAKEARTSILFVTGFVAIFYALLFVLGYGAISILFPEAKYQAAGGGLLGGSNMTVVHLADALGGPVLFGFIAAVTFATILSVVAGLTLAGAASVGHDLYAATRRRRGAVDEHAEVRVTKWAAVGLSIFAIGLSLMFEKQNIAYMVGLIFAIAASANFPVLLLTITWRPLTTSGALAGGVVGLLSAAGLALLSPAIWVGTFGWTTPIFPYENPALFSVPLAFVTAIVVSLNDTSAAAARLRGAFDAQYVRAQIGVDAD